MNTRNAFPTRGNEGQMYVPKEWSDRILKELYFNNALRSGIQAFVLANNGHLCDLDDLFHDALLALLKKIRDEEIAEIENLQDYFFGIVRNKWMTRLRNRRRRSGYESWCRDRPVVYEINPESRLDCEFFLQEISDRLSVKFQQLLRMWMIGFSMREISDRLGYTGPRSSSKLKYREIRRFRKYIRKNYPEYRLKEEDSTK